MRVLLDNCVNHRFGRLLQDAKVTHAREMGWAELSNGKLLSAAEEAGFDVLLAVDRSVRSQQNLSARKITLITLEARSILLEDLALFVPQVKSTLLNLAKQIGRGADIVLSLDKQKSPPY